MTVPSAQRRRGYTLMELVVAMGSATMLMTGLASALLIAGSAFQLDSATQAQKGTAAEVQADMMANLQHALSFTERTANAVTFTVPDRDKDGNPETIRYSWTGTPGDPLMYAYNGGTAVELTDDVQSFNLSYLTRTMLPESGGTLVYHEFTETSVAVSTSVTIGRPASTAGGDLLIAAVATEKDRASSLSAPAGWTQIAVDNYNDKTTLSIWWKTAGSSEPASYDFTWSSSAYAYGWIMRITGHDTSGPIDDSSSSANDSAISPISPAVSTTVSNAMIIRLVAIADGAGETDSPGLSGHTTITMDGNFKVDGGAGYVLQSDSGSSGTSSFSLTEPKESVTITIAIKPVP